MKQRALFISALIAGSLAFGALYSQADPYPKEEKAILEAIQEQDSSALIRSLVDRMQEDLEKDTERFPELIREVENYTRKCQDPATAALLHSLTAEMYLYYYRENSRTFSQRTTLQDYIPEDIRAWSPNLFDRKIREELQASLQPAELLQQTPTNRFREILEPGKDSETLRPTLFDFLTFRAIEMQPEAAWYQSLIDFHRKDGNRQAKLAAELEYLDFRRYQGQVPMDDARYEAILDSLETTAQGNPYAIEIDKRRWQQLQQKQYQGTQKEQNAIRAMLYQSCLENIRRYEGNRQVVFFQDRLKELEQSTIHVHAPLNVYPGQKLRLDLNYANVSEVNVSIYRNTNTPVNAFRDEDKHRGKKVKEQTFRLSLPDTYNEHDTILEIPMEELGLYIYEITVPDKDLRTAHTFSVSRLATSTRELKDQAIEVLVTDFLSGKPVQGAKVLRYNVEMQGEANVLETLKTDAFGLVHFTRKHQVPSEVIRAVYQDDTCSLNANIHRDYIKPARGNREIRYDIFTDRGLYRPGQSVFFKGIAYTDDPQQPATAEGETVTVRFLDPNRKEIGKQTVTSNRFGSFNSSFTLPKNTPNGMYYLEIQDRLFHSVRVEEYKRPNFTAELLPLRQEIFFGEPLELKGLARTFSGVNLQGGKVEWRVERRFQWSDMPYLSRDYRSRQVASGSCTIDGNGNFAISFTPERPLSPDKKQQVMYHYTVTATLTDPRGETQTCSQSFFIADRGLNLHISNNGQADKADTDFCIRIYTINNQKKEQGGSYTLYPISRTGEKGSPVLTGQFQAFQPIDSLAFSHLPSGKYRLVASALDARNQSCVDSTDVVLYGKDDRRPPIQTPIWLVKEKTVCQPGEDARFLFGTSDTTVYLLYELFTADRRLLKRERFVMTNENREFVIPFQDEFRDGVRVQFAFVKNGRLYQESLLLQQAEKNRKLTFHTESFRDKLMPGSTELWKFRLADADSLPVQAEILASMYDRSLDDILPFQWNFHSPAIPYRPTFFYNGGLVFQDDFGSDRTGTNSRGVPDYRFDKLYDGWYHMLYSYHGYGNLMYSVQGNSLRSKAAAPVAEMADAVDILAEEEVTFIDDNSATVIGAVPEGGETPAIRRNFQETAFFYPTLVSDEEGRFSFQFTLPESNTTWKLQMLALTDSLRHGYFQKEIITSKPLMVQPAWPRFLRQGDEVTITAQIINQSKETAQGRARIELFDPDNGQPVVCLTKSQRPFQLEADSSATVSWQFRVPSSESGAIGCRIIADSEEHSDGEQILLPVLSDQILVTESVPFYLSDEQEKTIRPAGRQASWKELRSVVEISAHPIWYAIQALPTLGEAESDNALDWFAVYYSQILAHSIVGSNPAWEQLIEQWNNRESQDESFRSNLEKNPELKQVLLSETPWLLEAADETEQMRQLALFFQPNRAEQIRQSAFQQLQQKQTPEGGWAWFSGMRPNRSITLQILKGMGQLVELGAIQYNQAEKEMQIKALRFLDQAIRKDYETIQKTKTDLSEVIPGSEQIEYLYVRSLYRDIPEGDAREAVRFYTAQAKKYWKKLPLYPRAATALLLHKNGDRKTAADILAWFRKTATTSAEKGTYWANNRRDFGGNSPVDTHCLIMQAFREIGDKTIPEDSLKQWLLNQKRTQRWESGPATVNAIHALLYRGSDWLSAQTPCTLTWGSEQYRTESDRPTTGYRKITREARPEDTAPAEIRIRKSGNAPAWGALYTQYLAPIRDIRQQGKEIRVEKKLFLEQTTGNQRTLQPVDAAHPIRTGDKVVVRLTIYNEQDLDFVCLKDLRAGCFEPARQISRTESAGNVWFFHTPKDVSENFYFDHLPAGTFVVEYPVYASRSGNYAEGTSTIQCLYAPEFTAHSAGGNLHVE